MFILTKIGPEWYYINKKADGKDFFYINCFSIIPTPTTRPLHNVESAEGGAK